MLACHLRIAYNTIRNVDTAFQSTKDNLQILNNKYVN